jgi:hypothetical protein
MERGQTITFPLTTPKAEEQGGVYAATVKKLAKK